MILAALLTATLTSQIDLSSLYAAANDGMTSKVTCNISTVGYRFVGKPGQEFRYGRETYSVPQTGSVELIASPRRTTYAFEGRTLPLDAGARDQFGFREITLPSETN